MTPEPTTLTDFTGDTNPSSNNTTTTPSESAPTESTSAEQSQSEQTTESAPAEEHTTEATNDDSGVEDATDASETSEEDNEDERFPWESASEVPVPDDAGDDVSADDSIPLDLMALEKFPAPDEITRLVENREVDGRGGTPDPDIIDPEQGVFLTLTAHEVYEYLVELQKKTDHWLNNEIKYNLQRQVIGQSHGMSENLKLEHYDKKWLALTEKERRKESDEYEWKAVPDSRGWQELPHDPDADWNSSSDSPDSSPDGETATTAAD